MVNIDVAVILLFLLYSQVETATSHL